jgi:hypothetical protein
MSLTIRKLNTNCLAPPEHASLKTVVDRFARGRLARDLESFLGPSLDRQPEVVRIRRLAVRLEIRAAELTEDFLAQVWVAALSRALFETLAHPDGSGAAQIRRYVTRATYLAEVARELAMHPGDSAAYPYEAAAREYGTGAGLVDALIAGEPGLIAAVLLELHSGQSLELLLAQLDEIAVENLIRVLERSGGFLVSQPRTIDLLLEVATSYAQERPVHGWPLRNRRNAIRIWIRLLKGGTRWSPRSIWAALQALALLMDHPEWLVTSNLQLDQEHSLPADVPDLLREVRHELAHLDPAALAGARERIFSAVKAIAPAHAAIAVAPNPAIQSAQQTQRWLSCEAGGLMLLVAVIRRLDWWRAVPELMFRYVISGAAAALAGKNYANDAAITLLAGAFDDLDRRGMSSYLAAAPHPAAELGLAANSWDELFERAAELLARNLASRVRGFRSASLDSVQKNVLRRHGRILIEKDRILVVLDNHAWNVALHLSGVDDPIESVEWFGGRRLEFVLEGV